MRKIILFILLVITVTLGACRASGEENKLRHDWKEERGGGEIRLISKHPAPLPFSMSGEPEASIVMEAQKIDPAKTSLAEKIQSEVEEIRKGVQIADYIEEDGRTPDRGIVTYVEEIDGHKVGFIKYRTSGVVESPSTLPRAVIHALILKGDRIYFIHLTVIFGGHQEEVRADQITLIKTFIRTS
jgi:hypothetical protein